MRSLENLSAIVTGASSGIGEALSLGLAKERMHLYLTGRDKLRLKDVATCCSKYSSIVRYHDANLVVDSEIECLMSMLQRELISADVLIHCAGLVLTGPVSTATVEDFDLQYRVNLRAPYILTQALLPKLQASNGQVVFINSSVGLTARAEVSQYAATKHGLKAMADALRAEVNEEGVRVLSIYLGRTATPAQAKIFQKEGRVYKSEHLLQPQDIASTIIAALKSDLTAEITDINIRPMKKT
jgi:short-subunit dehydrogenase